MGLSVFFAIATGLYFSHKMAGPIYRFKVELTRIEEGKRARPIILRKGDYWQEFVADFNRIVERYQTETVEQRPIDKSATSDPVTDDPVTEPAELAV